MSLSLPLRPLLLTAHALSQINKYNLKKTKNKAEIRMEKNFSTAFRNGEKEYLKGLWIPVPVFLAVPEIHQKFPLGPTAANKFVKKLNSTE